MARSADTPKATVSRKTHYAQQRISYNGHLLEIGDELDHVEAEILESLVERGLAGTHRPDAE